MSTITPIQFDALATLSKLRPDSMGYAGARMVFVEGLTISQAAARIGTHRSTVSPSVKTLRRAITLVHQAVTGEKAE